MTLTTFRPSAENVSPTVYSVLAGFAATLIDATVGVNAVVFSVGLESEQTSTTSSMQPLASSARPMSEKLSHRAPSGAASAGTVNVVVTYCGSPAFVSAVVDAVASSSVYCAHAEPVPLPALRLFTVAVATWDQKTREGMILLVNRDEHNAHDVTIDLTSLPRLGEWPSVTSSQMLPSDDIYRTNTADEPDGVTLQPLSAALDEGRMTVSLPPVTWASVRFTA